MLSHYEIREKLGAGGMGVVYRARDANLGRDVAIKVLPESLCHDPERLSRFEREARLLASLNHPNVATLHGFEEAKALAFSSWSSSKGRLSPIESRGIPFPSKRHYTSFVRSPKGSKPLTTKVSFTGT